MSLQTCKQGACRSGFSASRKFMKLFPGWTTGTAPLQKLSAPCWEVQKPSRRMTQFLQHPEDPHSPPEPLHSHS